MLPARPSAATASIVWYWSSLWRPRSFRIRDHRVRHIRLCVFPDQDQSVSRLPIAVLRKPHFSSPPYWLSVLSPTLRMVSYSSFGGPARVLHRQQRTAKKNLVSTLSSKWSRVLTSQRRSKINPMPSGGCPVEQLGVSFSRTRLT